jgi:hypothetical protein
MALTNASRGGEARFSPKIYVLSLQKGGCRTKRPSMYWQLLPSGAVV